VRVDLQLPQVLAEQGVTGRCTTEELPAVHMQALRHLCHSFCQAARTDRAMQTELD
jgi:hypothetical protein